ncbi:hypothetical protein COB55_03605 [Candidatus Wolfebacteria bacterium]|nr:MAG: hypothetical protein COB55_03605 [Candidatus Wolfebacteria bacterium]
MKKLRLKKSITELVDDTLSLVSGDDESHNLSNVRSAKTLDNKIQATTQNWSWNKKHGYGGEYYQDPGLSINEDNIEEEETSISEEKVLGMIENIMKKRRNEQEGFATPTTIPTFEDFKQNHPILSKYTTVLTDRMKDREDNIEEYGSTILLEIINSFDIDDLSPQIKKTLINRIKGITVGNTV